MKKFLVLFLAISLVACSSDDDSPSSDPIIGTWTSSQDASALLGQLDPTLADMDLTMEFNFEFMSNGNLMQSMEFSSNDPTIQAQLPALNAELGETLTGTWENASDSPDFSNTSQTYIITQESESVSTVINFNSSFTEFTVTDEELTLTFNKQ